MIRITRMTIETVAFMLCLTGLVMSCEAQAGLNFPLSMHVVLTLLFTLCS